MTDIILTMLLFLVPITVFTVFGYLGLLSTKKRLQSRISAYANQGLMTKADATGTTDSFHGIAARRAAANRKSVFRYER